MNMPHYHITFGQVTIYSPGLSEFVLYINEKSRIRRFIPSTAYFEYQVINMSGWLLFLYNISFRLSLVACMVVSTSSFVRALHRNQVSKAEGGKYTPRFSIA
jgi:hypothetical protein